MRNFDVLTQKQMSVTFGFYCGNGWLSTPQARQEVDHIAAAGIRWVVLTPIVVQETCSSTVQFRDFELTPSDDELIGIIDYFHAKGIRVQLRPMLETLDGKGRLQVWFAPDGERIPGRRTDYWARWFDSMRRRAVHYAKLAEKTGCEIYCLDSELDHMIFENAHWKQVLEAVRQVYSGPVTSCHTSHTGMVDFERALSMPDHWFYDLDFLSISCYHPAADREGVPVGEMIENYKSQLYRFRSYAEKLGKPILFGECGCTSRVAGATRPPDLWPGPYSGQEQANYLTAVVETFKNEPWWLGLCWWKWDDFLHRPFYDADPAGHIGFTIKNKPAEPLFAHYTKEFSK